MPIELNTFRTSFGWCAMLGEGSTLHGLTFGHPSIHSAVTWLDEHWPNCNAADAKRANWNAPLARRIVAMLKGKHDEFRDVKIADSHLTPFGRKVIAACRKIPWGYTCSYGDLAKLAGSAKAARAVGHFMSNNRTPLIVPCHRVVGSGGRLGGYSARQGLTTKCQLLSLESDCACCG